MVDIYRAPTSKEQPGWRGPARLLDLNYDTGGATVCWQGRPFLIPFRHIRNHIGWILSYLCVRESTAALRTGSKERELTKDPGTSRIYNLSGVMDSMLELIDIVDGGLDGKQFLHGKVMDTKTKRFTYVPPELRHGATKQ